MYSGESYVSTDSWVLTFTLNLQPYADHLQELEREVSFFEAEILSMVDEYETDLPANQSTFAALHQDITSILQTEVRQVLNEMTWLKELYSELDIVASGTKGSRLTRIERGHPRRRRALLPFMGQILAGLFGTVAEGDVKDMKGQLRILAGQQEDISHVLEKALSVVNQTTLDVQLNREAINQLSQAVAQTKREFQTIFSDFAKVVNEELVYNQFISRIHGILHAVTASLRQTAQALLTLKGQIQDGMRGKFPMGLITPRDLRVQLRRIASQLPQGYLFPYDTDDLSLYYGTMPATLVGSKSALFISIAIPLALATSLFSIHQARYVPIPVGPPSDGLVGEYILEAPAIMVSATQEHYALLNNEQAKLCSHGLIKICDFDIPIFSTLEAPSCAMSLFLKDKTLIAQHCQTKTYPAPAVPVVEHLFDGKWLVYTQERLSVELSCLEDRKKSVYRSPIIINPANQLLDIDPSCTASTKYWTLLPYFRKTSSEEVENAWQLETLKYADLKAKPNETYLQPIAPIATPTDEKIEKLPEFLPGRVKEIDDLVAKLKHNRPVPDPPRQSAAWKIALFVAIGVVFVLILVIITIVLLARRRKDDRHVAYASVSAPRVSAPRPPHSPTEPGASDFVLRLTGGDGLESNPYEEPIN